MKNTCDCGFITELCQLQSQTSAENLLTTHRRRDSMWAVRHMNYSLNWNNYGTEFLLGIWVTDQRASKFLLNATSAIMWNEREFCTHSPKWCCWIEFVIESTIIETWQGFGLTWFQIYFTIFFLSKVCLFCI